MTMPRKKKEVSPDRPCAMFWDESLIWGIMARQALTAAGLPFDLLTSEDIRQGMLSQYRMIFVPGGWASNKLDALGSQGRDNIRRFVEAGGSYLGICGGAGMALEEGIGLLSIVRRPTADRVPSFSGPIRLDCTRHPIWNAVPAPDFFAWWPSQFHINGGDVRDIRILAAYDKPMNGAFSADIGLKAGEAAGWPKLERRYGILLNPARLHGEPAVLEGRCGRGRVILSLIHFDTPDDPNGALVLKNIWQYLASCTPGQQRKKDKAQGDKSIAEPTPEILRLIDEIKGIVEDLFDTGVKNFLWHRRTPLLLQWRRGVRGLEYSTLMAMIRDVLSHIDTTHIKGSEAKLERDLAEIRDLLIPFVEKAGKLLVRERFYMQNAVLSPLTSEDEEINRLRKDLFGPAMRHGSDFKHLIDRIDSLLFRLMKESGQDRFSPSA